MSSAEWRPFGGGGGDGAEFIWVAKDSSRGQHWTDAQVLDNSLWELLCGQIQIFS